MSHGPVSLRECTFVAASRAALAACSRLTHTAADGLRGGARAESHASRRAAERGSTFGALEKLSGKMTETLTRSIRCARPGPNHLLSEQSPTSSATIIGLTSSNSLLLSSSRSTSCAAVRTVEATAQHGPRKGKDAAGPPALDALGVACDGAPSWS